MFSFFKNIKQPQETITKDLLEERLIESDVEYDIVEKILDSVGNKITRNELEVNLIRFLKKDSFYDNLSIKKIHSKPLVYLIIGVNGAGKTTTIAKLGNISKNKGKKVMLGERD